MRVLQLGLIMMQRTVPSAAVHECLDEVGLGIVNRCSQPIDAPDPLLDNPVNSANPVDQGNIMVQLFEAVRVAECERFHDRLPVPVEVRRAGERTPPSLARSRSSTSRPTASEIRA